MLRKSALAALLAGCVFAPSAKAATVSGTATVRILQAITVTKTADLNFGKVVAAAGASSVTISPDGVRICGTGLTCFGESSAGSFAVTGTPGETVVIALESPTTELTNGLGQSMTATLALNLQALTLQGNNPGTFKVGGTLTVGANQASGTYAGRFNVSVNYQ